MRLAKDDCETANCTLSIITAELTAAIDTSTRETDRLEEANCGNQ